MGKPQLTTPVCTSHVFTPLSYHIDKVLREGKNKCNASDISDFMRPFRITLLNEVSHLCMLRTKEEKVDLIHVVRLVLVHYKDETYQSIKAGQRNGADISRPLVLYAWLKKLQNEIEIRFYAYCGLDVKVSDRAMAQARMELHKKYREIQLLLNQYITTEHLTMATLSPIRHLLNKKQQPIEAIELQNMQAYMNAVMALLPQTTAHKSNKGYVIVKNNNLEQQLAALLKQHQYPSPSIGAEWEKQEENALPIETQSGRSLRVMLSESVNFIGALIRVFKETKFIVNKNMTEVKRLLAWIVQPATKDNTTELALDFAYRNLSIETCQQLIIFFETCIEWLKNHIQTMQQAKPKRKK